MGIVERRERLRKQVRFDIINTAREIAREEGWQSVSIRKIADVIEYSPPILYEYFDSKDKLLEAIRKEGFDFLREENRKIKELYRNPEKQLLEVAQALWSFAMTQPEVFQVMFNLEGAFCQSKQVFKDEIDYRDNIVWEMIGAHRPRFSESVSKTYYEWWCMTFGFIAVTMATHKKSEFSNFESQYMESVRRYVRNIA